MTRPEQAPSAPSVPLSLEVIAESIPHMVWLADPAGSTDYFNERGIQYTGLPRQAHYGWHWVELVHPDDAKRALVGWEHATRTGTPYKLTYRIRRRDGEYRWHGFRALPVRDADGQVVRWIGTADELDGAVHVDDEQLVEQQAAQLQSMLEAVGQTPGRARRRRVERSSRSGEQHSVAEHLAPREVAVARLVGSGYTNAEIAKLLGVSLRTIEASRARLRQVLGVRTRAELVRVGHQFALVEPHGRRRPGRR
jgi:PAS domain S-box-containing protein